MDYVENDLGVTLGFTPYRYCFELTEAEVRKLMSEVKREDRQGDGRALVPQEDLREWLKTNTSGQYLVTSGLGGSMPTGDDETGIWVQFVDENDAFHFRMRF